MLLSAHLKGDCTTDYVILSANNNTMSNHFSGEQSSQKETPPLAGFLFNVQYS